MSKADENRKHEREELEQEKREREENREKSASEHNQELLDEGIEESFPASDPPSVSHID